MAVGHVSHYYVHVHATVSSKLNDSPGVHMATDMELCKVAAIRFTETCCLGL